MKEQQENRKKGFKARIVERYGGAAILPNRETVVLHGGRSVTVYGCRKILQYSPIEIRISLGKVDLSIEGNALYCDSFGAGCVTVCGSVERVSYLAVEKKKGANSRREAR